MVEINQDCPSVLVAVYGTLRNKCANHSVLGDSECLGTHRSEKKYSMYGRRAGFPILTHGNDSIVYEVYKVENPSILKSLHALEGCTGIPGHPSNWYDLEEIETPHGKAYIYIQPNYNPIDPSSIISTGDWLNKSL